MTDDMTLAKIPWRPFQNSKLPKQSIGLGRQTLSVCPTELLKGQRGGIVKEREREQMFGHWEVARSQVYFELQRETKGISKHH